MKSPIVNLTALVLIVVVVPVIVILGILILVDRLAPGLGVQALAFSAAALTAVLALVGVAVTQGVNAYNAWSGQERERVNARDDALQTYLDDTEASSESGDARSDRVEPEGTGARGAEIAAAMAKAQSLLLRLDPDRKRVLLQFLHDTRLIEKGANDVPCRAERCGPERG